MTITYRAIEDNAGGLHLYAFEGETCIYAAHGFEHHQGLLDDAIEQAESDPQAYLGWDSDVAACEAQGDWADMETHSRANKEIYSTAKGLDVGSFGAAARREFPSNISFV